MVGGKIAHMELIKKIEQITYLDRMGLRKLEIVILVKIIWMIIKERKTACTEGSIYCTISQGKNAGVPLMT